MLTAYGTIRQMAKESEKKRRAPQKSNWQKPIEVTPLQLLAIMLTCVLKDRITDEEVETICSVYYETIKDW